MGKQKNYEIFINGEKISDNIIIKEKIKELKGLKINDSDINDSVIIFNEEVIINNEEVPSQNMSLSGGG